MKFDRGYISQFFSTNSKTQETEFENPFLLIVEKKITSINTILVFLEHAVKTSRPLLIIAEDVESDALTTLILNKLKGGLKICCVKAPAFGDNRKNVLNDIAISTGATVISEEIGITLENSDVSMLGEAKKVLVTKDDTLITEGRGTESDIKNRIEQIRDAIDNTSSDYDKEKLQERLAKLCGGVAIIKVGGGSEVEVNEVKDRVTDSLNSTHAALAEGIVVGGGIALL